MKGHVRTPALLAARMVGQLFDGLEPRLGDELIDPGCGEGAFIAAVVDYCHKNQLLLPKITGIELDPYLAEESRSSFAGEPGVRILNQDFLTASLHRARFIVGNPPYVPITGLSVEERRRYRPLFAGAVERFDLYCLFYERSLGALGEDGRLCFVTPEKFEYVHSAAPLRRLLSKFTIESVEHLGEETFPGLVTYPTITTVRNRTPTSATKTDVTMRSSERFKVSLPSDGSPWTPVFNPPSNPVDSPLCLADVSIRVSCGVATGADSLYVYPDTQVPRVLSRFAYPTISGRQLGLAGPEKVKTTSSMLVPYDQSGKLLHPDQLADFLTFVSRPDVSRRLKSRSCISGGDRTWYRFHDNVPLSEILKPKILCKDIAQEPHFWFDEGGGIVPRHTVYYIVPRTGVDVRALLKYLNSKPANSWLKSNCQRAANGFYRLQSAVLKRLPVPISLGSSLLPFALSGRRPQGTNLNVGPRGKQSVLTAYLD